jgi:hypothetical protein
MASLYKVLGQARPADTNVADLYTVPAGGQVIVSTIIIANTTATAATYDLYVRPDAATADEGTAVAFGTAVAGNTSTSITIGATADAADVISVKSATASALTFTAFGLEIS